MLFLMRFALLSTVVLATYGSALAMVVSAQSTPEPNRYVRESQGYAGQFADVLEELDAFWFGIFSEAGVVYRAPAVIPLERPVQTGCGAAGPQDFAFYCPRNETIYYSPRGFAAHDLQIGDFAPIVVMAHEWGHHAQWLVGIVPEPGNAFELQADCFAGAYASKAGQQGLLDPGDITEAVMGSAAAGDPLGLPQDAPGAHGINDDRVIAFMRGYLDGVTGCGWQLSAAPQPPDQPQVPTQLSIAALLPSVLDLPQRQPFRLEAEGISTLTDMVEELPDPERTRQLLVQWGWEENVYRIYASDAPPPNAVGWVSLGIHRFSSVDGAAAALSYFAAARRNALGYEPLDVGLFADQTEALTGQAVNGRELVIYARRGNLIFRAAGIAPNGDPTADVFETLLIPLRQLVDEPRVVSSALFDLLPNEAHIETGLHMTEEHARSAGTIATTFLDVTEAERLFQNWGWRESAARVFTGKTRSGASRLEVSVFRLADHQAAAAALPYFLDARAEVLRLSPTTVPEGRADEARAIAGAVEGGYEATVYLRRGPHLFRITAIGEGNPMADLKELLQAW
ncbi:MAG: neutral zinc metallopeptidase [Chloroflexota bacterium]|nr:neutral zinc metallopeptidase [Chloroflexota bacterium]